MERRIFHLNWSEVKELRKSIDKVILPVGTIEAHGLTSLGTDAAIPERLSFEIAEPLDALVLPVVNYGITSSLLPYAGSVNIDDKVFEDYIFEIAKSVKKEGFKYFIIMNGHGGNNNALKNIKKRVYTETGMFVIVVHWWEYAYPICREVFGGDGGHAGVDETAMMYHIDPESVKIELADRADYFRIVDGIESVPSPSPYIVYSDSFAKITFDKAKIDEYHERVLKGLIDSLKTMISRIDANI